MINVKEQAIPSFIVPGRCAIALCFLLGACSEEAEKVSAQSADYAGAGSEACVAEASGPSGDNPFVNRALAEGRTPATHLSPLIANVRDRNTVSLNGNWQFLVDQLDMGDMGPTMRGGIGQARIARPTELLEYAFSDHDTLAVPGDWNSQEPTLQWYRGVVWYKREFNFQKRDDRRVFLYFGGAYIEKDIYLNGQFLTSHSGGFTAFNLDVTDFLNTGENVLIVKVDSRSHSAAVPTEYNDWKNYGGLTRDVMLLQVPEAFIQNYKIQLDPKAPDTVKGWVQLGGSSADEQVVIEIPEIGLSERFAVAEDGRAEFSFVADLVRWGPENPKRYQVAISTADDRVEEKIGFRTIETKETDILLNGQPLFLRGVSMHEESFSTTGRASTSEQAAEAVGYLKSLNANFVRLAHYQHNRHMVEAAEREGILIWSELPVYHAIDFGNRCTLNAAKRQFGEMIDRDQNRAAIVLWSISNETPISDARNHFLQELAKYVRNRDGTRLLTSALFGRPEEMALVASNVGKRVLKASGRNGILPKIMPDPDPATIVLDDPLGDLVDVVGYNEYLGWYVSAQAVDSMRADGWDITEQEFRDQLLKEMQEVSITTVFNKPLILSEFGAGAKQGFRSPTAELWSEEYQREVYKRQIRLLQNVPDLRGISPWVLKDFRSPYRLNNKYQNYWNRKGLVSESGVKKLAFYELRDYYESLKRAE